MKKKKMLIAVVLIYATWILTDKVLELFMNQYIWVYIRLEGYEFFRNYIFTETNISYCLHFFITYYFVIKKILKINMRKTAWSVGINDACLGIICIIMFCVNIVIINDEYKLYAGEIVGLLFTQVFFIAICEELVYRAAVSEILTKLSKIKRIILSAAIFAGIHKKIKLIKYAILMNLQANLTILI